MRRTLPYVAVLLVYSMTPAVGEITENVVHLLTQGHMAHAVDDHDHAPAGAEHGCSGPFHMCSCHSSVAFTAAVAGVDVGCGFPGQAAIDWPHEQAPSDGHLNGVYRPPIA